MVLRTFFQCIDYVSFLYLLERDTRRVVPNAIGFFFFFHNDIKGGFDFIEQLIEAQKAHVLPHFF